MIALVPTTLALALLAFALVKYLLSEREEPQSPAPLAPQRVLIETPIWPTI